MNSYAMRSFVAAAVTSLALIAVGSASADVAAGASAQGRDMSPWTVTHGR